MNDYVEYGTVEFYAQQFADIIADAQHDSPTTSDNLVAGFKLAINDWRKYHANQLLELERLDQTLND